MVGEPDYLLRVAVENMAAYEYLYTNRLATLPGVIRLTSQVAMKKLKDGGVIPV